MILLTKSPALCTWYFVALKTYSVVHEYCTHIESKRGTQTLKWNFRQLIRSTIRMIISPEGVPIAFIKKERRICMKNVSNLEAYVRFSMFKLLARPFFIPRILHWIFSLITKIFWSYNWVSNYIYAVGRRKYGLWREEGDKKVKIQRKTEKCI